MTARRPTAWPPGRGPLAVSFLVISLCLPGAVIGQDPPEPLRRTLWVAAGATIAPDGLAPITPGGTIPLRSRRLGFEIRVPVVEREGRPALSLPADLPPDWYDVGGSNGSSGAGTPRLKVLRDPGTLHVVHLTDIHWDEGPRQRALLGDALDAIRLLDPDVVLCGGDMMTDPTEAGMAELARLFEELPVPVLFAPGNHDHRSPELFRRNFSSRTWYSVDAGAFHLVVLDTGKADFLGSHRGEGLEEVQLRWLEDDLRRATGKATYILTHHSAAPGPDSFDEGGNEFRRLASTRGVKAVFSGHGHYDKVVDLATGREARGWGPGIPVIHTTTLGSSRLRGKGRGFRLAVLTAGGIAPATSRESLPAGSLVERTVTAGEGCRVSNGTGGPLPGVRLDLVAGKADPPGRSIWRGRLGSLEVESRSVDLPAGDLPVPGCLQAARRVTPTFPTPLP